MIETTAPALPSSLPQIIEAYGLAVQEITRAGELLESARKRVPQAFAPGTSETSDIGQPAGRFSTEEALRIFRQSTWRKLVDRTGVTAMMSERRRRELDEQLSERTCNLPEITETHIKAMLQSTLGSAQEFLAEAVLDVYRFLRPQSTWRPFKTNEQNKWQLGEKVILSGAVEAGHGTNPFRHNYHRQKELTALDNVFSLLAGRGPVTSFYGPLIDAIHASPDGNGATDMFAFKCFRNGNLHLRIRRKDLIDKLNLIANTGTELPGARP